MAFLLPQKGGRKVEGKIPLPPSEMPLFKGNPSDLVEVEVKFKKFSDEAKRAQWCLTPLRPATKKTACIKDLNKNLSPIQYFFLNLPAQ